MGLNGGEGLGLKNCDLHRNTPEGWLSQENLMIQVITIKAFIFVPENIFALHTICHAGRDLEKKKMDVVMSPWEKGVRSYPDTAWGAPQHKAATDHIASAHTPPRGARAPPVRRPAPLTAEAGGVSGQSPVPTKWLQVWAVWGKRSQVSSRFERA